MSVTIRYVRNGRVSTRECVANLRSQVVRWNGIAIVPTDFTAIVEKLVKYAGAELAYVFDSQGRELAKCEHLSGRQVCGNSLTWK